MEFLQSKLEFENKHLDAPESTSVLNLKTHITKFNKIYKEWHEKVNIIELNCKQYLSMAKELDQRGKSDYTKKIQNKPKHSNIVTSGIENMSYHRILQSVNNIEENLKISLSQHSIYSHYMSTEGILKSKIKEILDEEGDESDDINIIVSQMDGKEANDQTAIEPEVIESVPVVENQEQNTKEISDSPKVTGDRIKRVLHGKLNFNASLASNTRKFNANYLTNRWINMPPIKLSTSDQLNNTIKVWDIVQDLFTHLESTNINITKNFAMCAPNIAMRFTVNANQFVHGLYLVSYQYMYQFQQENKRKDMQDIVNLYSNSGQSFLMDLNKANTVEFDVPYFNFLNYGATIGSDQQLKNVGNTYATVFFKCISPLRLASSQCETMVSVTPAFCFKDINATGMIPNRGNPTSQFTERPGVSSERGQVISQMDDVEKLFGKLKFNNPAIQIAEKGLKMVGDLLTADKPTNTQPINNVVIRETMNTASGVGVDHSLSMRLDPTGTTSPYYPYASYSGKTKIDEISQLPGFYNVVALDVCATDRDHKFLFTLPVELMNENLNASMNMILMYPWSSKSDLNLRQYIPRGVNVAMMFSQLYRGSLKYKFYAVQTNFHSFSLLVAFVPFDTEKPISFEQAQSCEHTIINFGKENRSFEYVVPYINQTPFRKCKPYNMNASSVGDRLMGDAVSYGYVAVFQYNRGSVSNVCANTVDIVIEVSASTDMEFVGSRGCSNIKYASNRANMEALDFFPKPAFNQSIIEGTSDFMDSTNRQFKLAPIGESTVYRVILSGGVSVWEDLAVSVGSLNLNEMAVFGIPLVEQEIWSVIIKRQCSFAIESQGFTNANQIGTVDPNTVIKVAIVYVPTISETLSSYRFIVRRTGPSTNVTNTFSVPENIANSSQPIWLNLRIQAGAGAITNEQFASVSMSEITSQGLFETSGTQDQIESRIQTQALWSSEKSLDLIDLAKRWKIDNNIFMARDETPTFSPSNANISNEVTCIGVQCQYNSDYATNVTVGGIFGDVAPTEYEYGRSYTIGALDWINNSHLYYRGGYRKMLIFPKDLVQTATNRDHSVSRGYRNYQVTWIPPGDYCMPKAQTLLDWDFHTDNFVHSLKPNFLQYFGDVFFGSYPSQIVSTNVNNVLAIDMPYYNQYNFIPTNKLVSSSATVQTAHVNGLLCVRLIPDHPTMVQNPDNSAEAQQFLPIQINVNTMHALGDDAQFYGFWGFPMVEVVTTSYSTNATVNLMALNPIYTVNPTTIVNNNFIEEQSENLETLDFEIESQMEEEIDWVSEINMYCQDHKLPPPYYAFKRSIDSDNGEWLCEGLFTKKDETKLSCSGRGKTKKIAKQQVCKKIYQRIPSKINKERIKQSNKNITFQGEVESQMFRFFEKVTQSASHVYDFTKSATDSVANSVSQSPGLTLAAGLVNPGLAVAVTASKATKVLNRIDNGMTQTQENVGLIVKIASEMRDQIMDKITWVKDKGLAIFNSIVAILNVVINRSFNSLALNITSLFVNIGLATEGSFTDLYNWFIKLLGLSSTEQPSDEGVDSNMDTTDTDTIIGLGSALLSIILVSVGSVGSLVKNIPVIKIIHWFTKCLTIRNIKDCFMCFNSVATFLRSIQTLFFEGVNLVKWYIPGFSVDQALLTNMPEVKKWMEDIDVLTDARTNETLNAVPMYKERLWVAVSRSYYYRQLISTGVSGEALKKISSHVLKYCDRIVKFANDKKSVLACSPVRYEPFVINMYGASNIGKSFISEDVIVSLLKHINIEYAGNPIYVRTPGVPFWNMFTTQPAVLFDDFLAVKGETFAQTQIAELFNLKSTATFNPNMAAIEQKEIRANPIIVYLSSNSAFPPLEGVSHPEAVYRRRDQLIEAVLDEEVMQKYRVNEVRDLPDDIKNNFRHLKFAFHKNVKNPNNSDKTNYVSYEKMLSQLKILMRVYHTKEVKNVETRLDRLNVLLPECMKVYIGDMDSRLVINSRLDFVANLASITSNSCDQLTQDMSVVQGGILNHIERLRLYSSTYQEETISSIEDTMNVDMNSVRYRFKLPPRIFAEERVKYDSRTLHSPEDSGQRIDDNHFDAIGVAEDQPSTSGIESNMIDYVLAAATTIPQVRDTFEGYIRGSILRIADYSSLRPYAGYVGCCHVCHGGIENGEHVGGQVASFICVNSGECGNHIICVDCCEAYRQLNPARTCPDCRAPMSKIVNDRMDWKDYINPEFYLGRSIQKLNNFFNWIGGCNANWSECIENQSFNVAQTTVIALRTYALTSLYIKLLFAFADHVASAAYSVTSIIADPLGPDILTVEQIVELIEQGTHPNHTAIVDAVGEVMRSRLSGADQIQAVRIGATRAYNQSVYNANCCFECDYEDRTMDWEEFETFVRDQMPIRIFTNISQQVKRLNLCSLIDMSKIPNANLPTCQHTQLKEFIEYELPELDAIYNTNNEESRVQVWCANRLANNTNVQYVKTGDENYTLNWKSLLSVLNNEDPRIVADIKCNDNCIYFKYLPYIIRAYLQKTIRTFFITQGRVYYPPTVLCHDLFVEQNSLYDNFYDQVKLLIHKPWYVRLGDVVLKYWETIKTVGMIASAFAALYATYSFTSSIFSSSAESNLIASSGSRIIRAPRSVIRMNRGATVSNCGMDEFDSTSIFEVVKKKVLDNAVYINTTSGRSFRGMGIIGRYFIINNHYVEAIKNRTDEQITLSTGKSLTNSGKFAKVLSKLEIKEIWVEQDIAVCVIPAQLPMFKNIIPYILPSNQHENIDRCAAVLEYFPQYACQYATIISGIQNDIPVRARFNLMNELTHEGYKLGQAYAYDVVGNGKCGSLGMLYNNQTPIFSYHTAGNVSRGIGYATPLVQEWFKELAEECIVKSRIESNILDIPAKLQLNDEHYYRTSILENIPFVPKKSSILKSDIADTLQDIDGEVYQAHSQPAILDKYDIRYDKEMGTPYVLGIEKTGVEPVLEIDQKIHNEIIDFMAEEMIAKVKPTLANPKVLNRNEAVLGLEGKMYFDKLDYNTSAGYPYSCINSKKKYWLKVEEGSKVVEYDPYLVKILNMKDKQRKNGIVPLTLFMDCLKDERLPNEKVLLPGKTRIFSLSPLDFTIQCRQYFLSFVAAFQNSRLKYNHSVGIACDGQEWGSLLHNLKQFNADNVITGDYSGFGHTLSSQATLALIECINRWYQYYNPNTKQEDGIVRSVMGVELANAYHIAHDLIFECGSGCPSGSPLTVVLNSLVNMYYINWAWLKLCPNLGLSNLSKYIYYSVYGDDIIMAVKPELLEKVNNITLSNVFKEVNINFTDASKQGNIKYVSYEEATFLKRGFLKHPTRGGEYLAPLDIRSVKDCAYYIYKSPSTREATRVNAEQSLRLAYGHGPEFFNQWKKCLNIALDKKRIAHLLVTWDECDRNFFEYGDIVYQFDLNSEFENKEKRNDYITDYIILKIENNKILSCINSRTHQEIPVTDIDIAYIEEMSNTKFII